ncbi:MAG TPA: cytochrome c-type biogenesis protein CcmH [Gemmatimonadales bacterium]|nr:cytochrome c-type biogenesis protein CcmH [Gemmatimonadales bacterium]
MTDTLTERRAFLRQVALGGLALAGAGTLRAQDPAQGAPGGADAGRLYNPNAVQQRAPTVGADNDAQIMELEKTLKCQCGCNLDIYTCRTTDFTCTTSPALHREIVGLWNDNRTADQIREAFVSEYGEQALMAPKAEGFNLAGYFVPGILMLAGIAILSMWILRRQRQVAAVPSLAATEAIDIAAVAGATPEELERLRRALAEVKD